MTAKPKVHSVIGLDPTTKNLDTLDWFFRVLLRFHEANLVPSMSFAGVMHSHLFPMPNKIYRGLLPKLKKEAQQHLEAIVAHHVPIASVQLLSSDSPATEDHVNQLSRWGSKLRAEFLTIASQNQGDLAHWALGSFAETAALTSKLPVLIVKPYCPENHFDRPVSLLICVDVASPPAPSSLAMVVRLAKRSNARVHFLYVRPQKRVFTDSLFQRKSEEETQKILTQLKTALEDKGIKVTATIVDEKTSIAHSIDEFAADKKVWMIVTTVPKRARARRIFLGSSARKLLSLTKIPVLNLRAE